MPHGDVRRGPARFCSLYGECVLETFLALGGVFGPKKRRDYGSQIQRAKGSSAGDLREPRAFEPLGLGNPGGVLPYSRQLQLPRPIASLRFVAEGS